MSATAIMAPGLLVPDVVDVHGPGTPPSWTADGRVIGRAPYSVCVEWERGHERSERAWFAWEPGQARHRRQHGVADEFAIWIEAGE